MYGILANIQPTHPSINNFNVSCNFYDITKVVLHKDGAGVVYSLT